MLTKPFSSCTLFCFAIIDSMADKLQNDLPAFSIQRRLIWLVLLPICFLILVGLLFLWRDNPDQNFWFVPRPPVPPFALHVQKLGPGSLPGYRITRYETDQPADMTRQFYQIELARRGWSHLCSPTQLEQPNCPLGLSPAGELADAYRPDDGSSLFQEIDITVFRPGENLPGSNHRQVEIVEYRYPITAP